MILAGVALLERFHGLLYVFGAFLIVTGLKMALRRPHQDPAQNPLIVWARRWLPITEEVRDGRFVARVDGVPRLTPLAPALIVIETSDLRDKRRYWNRSTMPTSARRDPGSRRVHVPARSPLRGPWKTPSRPSESGGTGTCHRMT